MLKIKMGISCDMFAFICESMAFLVSNQKRTKRGKQRTVKPHILINNLTFEIVMIRQWWLNGAICYRR